MEIKYSNSRTSFSVYFGYPSITFNYNLKLSAFFDSFSSKVMRNSKKTIIDYLETSDGLYILSSSNGEVFFSHRDQSTLIYGDDLKSISNAMSNYLDKRFLEYKNGESISCGSGFIVPKYHMI